MSCVRHCDVAGCERVHYGRGLCRLHYRRAWEVWPGRKVPLGDAGLAGKAWDRQAAPPTCTVDGCDKRPVGKGICAMHRRRWRLYGTYDLVEVGTICLTCGKLFTYQRDIATAGTQHCSDRCRREARAQRSRLRQAKIRNAPLIDPLAVAERDGWLCQLCGEPVDPAAPKRSRLGASIDHIVPLSRGGEHTWTNVQLAHLGCNCRKHNRLEHEVSSWPG